eukprot:m.146342 g.146342  ORF g.146342 m.146342 type:complete len:210 (+) comp23100_c0_seq3:359-988(+)
MALEVATVVTGLVNVMATLCVIIIRVALKVTVSMAYGLGTVAQIGFNTLVRVVIPTVAPMLPGIFASIGSALWHVCYAVGYVGWRILGAIPGALAGVIRALAVVAGYGISASKVRRGCRSPDDHCAVRSPRASRTRCPCAVSSVRLERLKAYAASLTIDLLESGRMLVQKDDNIGATDWSVRLWGRTIDRCSEVAQAVLRQLHAVQEIG